MNEVPVEFRPAQTTLIEVTDEVTLQCTTLEQVALAVQAKAIASLAQSFSAIAKFLGNSTLPQVLESHAVMQSVGQVLNGLTSHAGRQGLDARTIKVDATDATHRILQAFSHLKETIEARRNGDFAEHLDAESDYLKWKESQSDGGQSKD